jgi:hypothetical protein
VAGGTGGPAKASHVVIQVLRVSFGGGNAYISGNVVREVDPATGRMSTVAGNGFSLPFGNDRQAVKAGLVANQTALDHAGNLVIDDAGHSQIRVVAGSTGTFYGQHMTQRRIYLIAGHGRQGYSGDGGPATAAQLDEPFGLALDGSGLVFADFGNGRVREITG